MTVKVIYKNSLGRNTEAEVFTSSEFVLSPTPNSPVKTGPSGIIPSELLPPVSVASVEKVTITRKAQGTILRGQPVSPYTAGYVQFSDPKMGLQEASVLGVALNRADQDEDVEILIFGVMSDPIFNVFQVCDYLFLDENGEIFNEKPLSSNGFKYQVDIGKALGANEIFVNIGKPTKLGV